MKQDPIGVLIDGETHEKKKRASKNMRFGDHCGGLSAGRGESEQPTTIEISIHAREKEGHGHHRDRHALLVVIDAKWKNERPVDVMKFP